MFLEVSCEPKMHLLAVCGVWSTDGLVARLPPDPDGVGRGAPTPSVHLALQGSLGLAPRWRRLWAGLGCRQRWEARPGPCGMVPWGQSQGHGQLWPELCLPRSDGAVVTPQPRWPHPAQVCSVHHGQGEPPGQLASRGGRPGPLRLEALPSGVRPRCPRRGGEPAEVPTPLRGLGPDPASLLPVTAPNHPHSPAWLQGAGKCREPPDPGEHWGSLHPWPRAAARAHGHVDGVGAV